eukprot:Nk52_evm6s32 gene=Nk52_evmTU6s32
MDHNEAVRLVLGFLSESNYPGAVTALENEARITVHTQEGDGGFICRGEGEASVPAGRLMDLLSKAYMMELHEEMERLDATAGGAPGNGAAAGAGAAHLAAATELDFPIPDRRGLSLFHKGVFTRQERYSFANGHVGNILCVRVVQDASPNHLLVLSGGADGCVNIGRLLYSASPAASSVEDAALSGSTVPLAAHIRVQPLQSTQAHQGGVLCAEANPVWPHLVLTGGMDKSHCLVDVVKGLSSLRRFKDHSKYVVRTKWSLCGDFFATASYDKMVGIYGRSSECSSSSARPQCDEYRLLLRRQFKGSVEALCFIDIAEYDGEASSGIGGPRPVLIVACRDDALIQFIDVVGCLEDPECQVESEEEGGETFAYVADKYVRFLNVNELGDLHVSFTVLDMSVNPIVNRKGRGVDVREEEEVNRVMSRVRFLLVSTDKNRLILFDIGDVLDSFYCLPEKSSSGGTSLNARRTFTGRIVRNFYGINSDEFSTPRHCWHDSGQYIYGSSQDGGVYSWEVKTQEKCSMALKGHTSIVRDVTFGKMRLHPEEPEEEDSEQCLQRMWGAESYRRKGSGESEKRAEEEIPVLVTCGFDKTIKIWHY